MGFWPAFGFGSPTDVGAQSSDAVGPGSVFESPGGLGPTGAVISADEIPPTITGATTPTESLGFPKVQTPDIFGNGIGPAVTSLISTGLSAYKSQLGTDLLQSQINHGQTPSVVFDSNGNPSGPFTITKGPNGISTITAGSATATALGGLSGSLILFLVIGGVILFALTRR